MSEPERRQLREWQRFVRVDELLVERLSGEWSRPLQVRIERHDGDELVLVFREVGFTHEDVALLHGDLYGGFVRDSSDLWTHMNDLADRIAALLPPEGPSHE